MFRIFEEGHTRDIQERSDLITVFIGFDKKPTDYHHNIIREHGGFLKFSYDITDAVSARVPIDMVDKIRRLPGVKYVEKVGIMYTHNYMHDYGSNSYYNYYNKQQHAVSPDSNRYSNSYIEPYACHAWGIINIRANEAHDHGYKGTGIKIGIVDSGVQETHPDLKANFVEGINIIDGGGTHSDTCGHGTHVAGIAANTKGDLGVAPEAKIYSAQVVKQQNDCDGQGPGCCGGEDVVAAGIDWAVGKGVKIINMSLGGDLDVTALRDACNNSYNQGVLIITSAGNGNGSDCTTSNTVAYPALYDSCIAISNTQINDTISSGSSRGPKVELAAPGTSINSTIPTNSYGCKSGTSMSAPHVTGTAALIFGAFPNLTNIDVRKALQLGAIDLGAVKGRDNCYGYGRIDAMKTIEAAGNTKCPINIQFGLN